MMNVLHKVIDGLATMLLAVVLTQYFRLPIRFHFGIKTASFHDPGSGKRMRYNKIDG